MTNSIPKTIRPIMLSLLEKELIVTSWGISNLSFTDLEVMFCVCGLKRKGTVSIRLDSEQGYYNLFLNGRHIAKCKIEHIVEILDEEIEHIEGYASFLQKAFF